MSVSGRVTKPDGQPLVGARVMFRDPATGVAANGITDSDGRYELGAMEKGSGIAPGNYGVAVSEDLGSWDSPRKPTVDPKYRNAKTSGLTAEVKAGESKTFDIALE